jgi:hypothetical protein
LIILKKLPKILVFPKKWQKFRLFQKILKIATKLKNSQNFKFHSPFLLTNFNKTKLILKYNQHPATIPKNVTSNQSKTSGAHCSKNKKTDIFGEQVPLKNAIFLARNHHKRLIASMFRRCPQSETIGKR